MKRFTDTEKWQDPWFRSLPPKLKLAWLYICDTCDAAGFWKVDTGLLSFVVGDKVTEQSMLGAFDGRVLEFSADLWFIPQFIAFQYGKLSPHSRFHSQAYKALEKRGLSDGELPKAMEKRGRAVKEPKPQLELEVPGKAEALDDTINRIIDYWCNEHPGKRRPKKSDAKTSAWVKVTARLRAGRTEEEIQQGIKGNAQDSFYCSINKHGLEFVCQSCERLDEMIEKLNAPPKMPRGFGSESAIDAEKRKKAENEAAIRRYRKGMEEAEARRRGEAVVPVKSIGELLGGGDLAKLGLGKRT